MELQPERQAQVIFRFEVFVSEFTEEIQVAGTEFIKEGDGFMPSPRIVEFEGDAFAQEDVGTYPCREEVISVGVFAGAMYPVIPGEQGADIQTCCQWIEIDAFM